MEERRPRERRDTPAPPSPSSRIASGFAGRYPETHGPAFRAPGERFWGVVRTAYTRVMAQTINSGTVLLTARVPVSLAAQLRAVAQAEGSNTSRELRRLVEKRVGAAAQGRKAA